MLRLTPVVKNLLLINVAVFIGQMIAPNSDFGYCVGEGFHDVFDSITGYLSMWNTKTSCFRPYQLFTYMFVHSSLGHIFFNMLGLSFFGPVLEEFWGQKRFLMFYMICGIGAGVIWILIDMYFGARGPSIMGGASGAVYGVLTAFGIIFPNMELRLFFLPMFSFKAKYLVMFLGSVAIYSSFRASPGDNTAHLAHLGGIVVAIILIQIWRSGRRY